MAASGTRVPGREKAEGGSRFSYIRSGRSAPPRDHDPALRDARVDNLRAVETDRRDLIGVLEEFCDAFRRRDIDAVADLLLPRDDVMVVTSEEPVLRNRAQFDAFLERYAKGAATYSWDWQRTTVAVSEQVAWLLAEGIETAESDLGAVRTPYRMTMLCRRHDGRWKIAQVHGSSPHHL